MEPEPFPPWEGQKSTHSREEWLKLQPRFHPLRLEKSKISIQGSAPAYEARTELPFQAAMASVDEASAGDTPRDAPGPDGAGEEGGGEVDAEEPVPKVVMGIYVIVCRMCKTMLCRGDELLQDAINSDPTNGNYFVEVIRSGHEPYLCSRFAS